VKLDRKLQLRMLEALKETYPTHNPHFAQAFRSEAGYIPNLHYLKDHGLLTGIDPKTSKELLNIKITGAGLDFLEGDGGITAMLRTVTVRLDAEQFRQILAAKVEALSIAQDQKDSILSKIRSLPAEALNSLALKLLEKGVEHFPDLLQLLQSVPSASAGGFPPGMTV
jgi:hypothetical protein